MKKKPCVECDDLTEYRMFGMPICPFCIAEYKQNLRRQIVELIRQDKLAKRPTTRVEIKVKLRQKPKPVGMMYSTEHGRREMIDAEVNRRVTGKWASFDIETVNWRIAG